VRSSPHEFLPEETRRVLDDARDLRDRLERLLHTLALTSELTADVLERAAQTVPAQSQSLLLAAKKAREDAWLYHDVLRRVVGNRSGPEGLDAIV
jgi:hypothetical protein